MVFVVFVQPSFPLTCWTHSTLFVRLVGQSVRTYSVAQKTIPLQILYLCFCVPNLFQSTLKYENIFLGHPVIFANKPLSNTMHVLCSSHSLIRSRQISGVRFILDLATIFWTNKFLSNVEIMTLLSHSHNGCQLNQQFSTFFNIDHCQPGLRWSIIHWVALFNFNHDQYLHWIPSSCFNNVMRARNCEERFKNFVH